jgi:hypothetical protein
MDALRSPETLVLTRATWRNIPEDGILKLYLRFLPTGSKTNNAQRVAEIQHYDRSGFRVLKH